MTEPAQSPPQQESTPQQKRAEEQESPLQAILSVVTTLGPPLTIATALMIYFGWARSDTQAREMGLDVSLFGFSTQDYVLQSISTLYVPLLCIAALTLGGLAVHRRLDAARRRTEARGALGRAGRIAILAGLTLIALAILVATIAPGSADLIIPLVLASGTIVAVYGGWLRTAADSGESPTHPPWHRALRTLLIGSVVTLALFWEVSNFATVVGRGYAQRVETNVPKMPRVTVFSSTPLGIEAPGVAEEPINGVPANGTAFRYRTSGLRFLVTSGGRMFLLHDGWTASGGTVIVLPDNEQIRWQFSR